MTFLAALFPSYRLMESALLSSRREAEDLRTELGIARQTTVEAKARYEEERAELRELRERHEKSLIQAANFMAYAKTARMIFVEQGGDLPLSAPPVTNEQLTMRSTMRERAAAAKKKFDDDIAAFSKSEAA